MIVLADLTALKNKIVFKKMIKYKKKTVENLIIRSAWRIVQDICKKHKIAQKNIVQALRKMGIVKKIVILRNNMIVLKIVIKIILKIAWRKQRIVKKIAQKKNLKIAINIVMTFKRRIVHKIVKNKNQIA